MRAATLHAALLRTIGLGAIGLAAISLAVLLPLGGARAQWLPFDPLIWHGNDTGGIIPWSCENEAAALPAAAHYCARYRKYARIISVTRAYGDFISFDCLWSPNVDRFARPPAATRTACAAQPRPLVTK